MYRIILSKTVFKIYKKLTISEKKKVNKSIDQIKLDPRNHPNIKSLKGSLSGFYRCRAGDIRIKYSVVDKEKVVYIVDIDYRGNIY